MAAGLIVTARNEPAPHGCGAGLRMQAITPDRRRFWRSSLFQRGEQVGERGFDAGEFLAHR